MGRLEGREGSRRGSQPCKQPWEEGSRHNFQPRPSYFVAPLTNLLTLLYDLTLLSPSLLGLIFLTHDVGLTFWSYISRHSWKDQSAQKDDVIYSTHDIQTTF